MMKLEFSTAHRSKRSNWFAGLAAIPAVLIGFAVVAAGAVFFMVLALLALVAFASKSLWLPRWRAYLQKRMAQSIHRPHRSPAGESEAASSDVHPNARPAKRATGDVIEGEWREVKDR